MDITKILHKLEYAVLFYITIYLLISDKHTDGLEYPVHKATDGSFTFYKKMFNCTSEQRIGWDILVIVVATNSQRETCDTVLNRFQNIMFWNDIDRCLNSGTTSIPGCSLDEEDSLKYRVQMSLIVNSTYHSKVYFPCQQSVEEPEITDLHMIFVCMAQNDDEHHDGETQTTPHPMPDLGTTPEDLPPPPDAPTMAEHGDHDQTDPLHTTTHHVVTPVPGHTDKTTETIKEFTTENPESPPVATHPVTKDELATIVGPSVACLAVVIIAAVAVIVYLKRKHTGFPRDLQGESLFSSRRFSTASQISDVSINIQPMQTQP